MRNREKRLSRGRFVCLVPQDKRDVPSNVFVILRKQSFRRDYETRNAENVVKMSAFRESNATLLVEIQVAYVPGLSACSVAWRTRTKWCVFGFRTRLLERHARNFLQEIQKKSREKFLFKNVKGFASALALTHVFLDQTRFAATLLLLSHLLTENSPRMCNPIYI